MSRWLLVAMLAACAAEAEPTPAGLDVWLDTWVEARKCLLGDADTTYDAAAIAVLAGNDCSKQLFQLDVRVPEHSLSSTWRHAIDRSQLLMLNTVPVLRAPIIDEVDAVATLLGVAIDHRLSPRAHGSSLQQLKDPVPLFGGARPSAKGARFNGGVVEGTVLESRQQTNRFLVRAFDSEQRVEIPSRTKLAFPSLSWHAFSRAIAAADDGDHRLVVYRIEDDPRAYGIRSSRDGGKTWAKQIVRDGHLVNSWQNRRTGEVTLLIERDRRHFRHRLNATDPKPRVDELGLWGVIDDTATTCEHDGEAWMLDNESVLRLGQADDHRELHGWGDGADLDCRFSTALVLRHSPDVVEKCTKNCKVVFTPPDGSRGGAGLLRDERWIYAANLGGVIAVWNEARRPPKFFRVSSNDQVVAITAFTTGPVLILRSEDERYSMVPLP